MGSVLKATFVLPDTQPVAALGCIPFASPQPGQLDTDPLLAYNNTENCLILPVLAANPATAPAGATASFFYIILSGGTTSLRVKHSDTTVRNVNLA